MSRKEPLGTRELFALAGAWLLAVAVAGVGTISLSLVDQVVFFAVAVVLPLSVGGRAWWWVATTGAALIGFLVPVGPAGLFACPFLLVAVAGLRQRLQAARPLAAWRLAPGAEVLAAAYALVAAAFLVQSRLGLEPLDLHEPIIELTAVHYSFAGTAALVLAAHTLDLAVGGWRPVAVGAVVLTAAAPPIVAAGFVTDSAAPQVGGAVLMTLGVWLTTTLQLRHAMTSWRDVMRSGLLVVSGLAVWAPMVLALAWAAGQHWDIPVLSIPDMARTHGVANAFAFCLCGLLARRLASPATRRAAVTVSA